MYYIRTTSTSCPSWPPWPWEPEASCALGGAMAPGCPLGHHSKAKEAARQALKSKKRNKYCDKYCNHAY